MSDIKRDPKLIVKSPRAIFLERCPSEALDIIYLIGVHLNSVRYWLLYDRDLTVDIAMDLERMTDISAEFWLNAQLAYDLHKIATRNSEK